MRVPHRLESLYEMGIIQEVVRPLMSGKEAQLYVVVAGGVERVAKVYKEADQRSFKQRTDYMDGRKVRNSRDRRAMAKGSRHGRERDEQAWQSTEVDVIYKLRNAGVRVPNPYNFMDGVLIMDMVADEEGEPAPRLGDLSFTPQQARFVYDSLMQQVVRMLCAGVVHGDLSDFNILLDDEGPVIIDFPQAVDASSNSSARRLLIRDVDNLHDFLGRATHHPRLPYAQEMWTLYERNELTPDTTLSGRFRDDRRPVNTKEVLGLIGEAKRDAKRDEARRRGAPGKPRRGGPAPRAPQGPKVEVLVRSGSGRTQIVSAGDRAKVGPGPAPTPATEAPAKKKRRRRRRRSSSDSSSSS